MVAAALTRHRSLISRLALLALVHLWEHLLVPRILLTNPIHHLNCLLTAHRQPSRAMRASPLHQFHPHHHSHHRRLLCHLLLPLSFSFLKISLPPTLLPSLTPSPSVSTVPVLIVLSRQ